MDEMHSEQASTPASEGSAETPVTPTDAAPAEAPAPAEADTDAIESAIGEGKLEAEVDQDAPAIGDKPATDAEEGEGDPGFDVSPVEVDNVELPEGFEFDEARGTEMLDIINNATSKADLANKILGLYSEVLTENAQQTAENWNNLQSEWRKELSADPDFGGSKQAESLAKANAIATKYGGPEFTQLLGVTGTGNHVAMFRFLNKVAADLPQDAIPLAGDPVQPEMSLADRMFGT